MEFEERPASSKGLKSRRAILGVGVNDATYSIKYQNTDGTWQVCPYYTTWVSMLTRCYSLKLHQRSATYAECTIEPSWKVFSNFKAWMVTQNWQGKQLDKDLLVQGNSHYGPETCLFISHALNSLLCLCGKARGIWPLGVSRAVRNGYTYFIASCSFYGKGHLLGYFKTPEEAAAKYKEAKLGYIAELANSEPNPVIKAALLRLF